MNNNKLNTCETCFVNNDLFRKMTKDEIDILSYIKNCNTYDKGDIIYSEGSRISGVYCLNSGIVKHYKTGNDGKEQIIRFSKAGEIFGYRSVLSNEAACTTAKVVEESSVCIIPAAHFMTLINTNSNFALSVIKLSCRELGDANQSILDIAQKNVRERLAEILLLLHENFGINKDGDLNIFLTREELAGLVGTATESVIRFTFRIQKRRSD